MEKLIVLYLLIVNAVAFVTYGIDKWRARHYLWRVPEVWLLALAVVGGSVGALLAMVVFHHKTRHARFAYGVPGILAVQLALAWLCL